MTQQEFLFQLRDIEDEMSQQKWIYGRLTEKYHQLDKERDMLIAKAREAGIQVIWH